MDKDSGKAIPCPECGTDLHEPESCEVSITRGVEERWYGNAINDDADGLVVDAVELDDTDEHVMTTTVRCITCGHVLAPPEFPLIAKVQGQEV